MCVYLCYGYPGTVHTMYTRTAVARECIYKFILTCEGTLNTVHSCYLYVHRYRVPGRRLMKLLHNKTSQQHIDNFFVFHPGRCIPTFQHTFILHFHPLTHYHTHFFCIASRHFWWCKFTFNI